MKIRSKNKRPEPKHIFYICNRQRCAECHPDCHWTADINYALYDTHYDFSPELDGLYERVRKWT